jgi:hypothetical protein
VPQVRVVEMRQQLKAAVAVHQEAVLLVVTAVKMLAVEVVVVLVGRAAQALQLVVMVVQVQTQLLLVVL